MRSLDSPQVVKIFDIVKDSNNLPSAVLELCDGTLQDLIEEKKKEGFKEEEIREIIKSIAESLSYIHSNGIIHRDLKPENILYKNEGGIKIWKLTDFGSSIKKENKLKTTVRHAYTDYYASIQQLSQQEAFPYFDTWSLGIISYQMMSGDVPYKVVNSKMIEEIQTKERPHIEKFSIALNYLVDRMLTIDVNKRIKIDGILETFLFDEYCQKEVPEERKQGLKYVESADFGVGDVYTGYLQKGKFHGHGTYTFANSDKYEGKWKQGKQHGKGKNVKKNGEVYEGDYDDGKKHGQGKEYYENGSKYKGEFKSGKKDGKGVLKWINGERYDGEWKNDKRHGKGVHTWANGDKYDGEFEDNKSHGQGMYTKADGSGFIGEFRNGKPHGNGVKLLAGGRI